MHKQYDAAIIGGGIFGVTTAYELASQGAKVILLEKGALGAEQSGRNWGWVRRLGRDRRERALAKLSLERWVDLQSKAELGFRQNGMLRLFADEKQRDHIMGQAGAIEPDGYKYSFLDPSAIAGMTKISPDHYQAGALLAPDEACAEPDVATNAIAALAREAGADIRTNTAVKDLIFEKGRLKGVVAAGAEIRADKVLIAAGAWSARIAKLAKLSLPQAYVIGSVAATKIGAETLPTSLLRSNSIAVRQRMDGGLTLGVTKHMRLCPTWGTIRHTSQFLRVFMQMKEDVLNPESLAALGYLLNGGPFRAANTNAPLDPAPSTRPVRNAQALVQNVLSTPIDITKQWAGVIEGTPDAVPVLGTLPGYDNLYIATGFSGHGFGLGPGVGLVMSQLIRGARPAIDLAPFALARLNEPLEIEVTF